MHKVSGTPVKIIDISPLLRKDLAVWPGDTPFKRIINQNMENGDAVNLSSIETTLHLGAHLDAPLHVFKEGIPVDQLPLSLFYGECQLIEVCLTSGQAILPEDIKDRLESTRILLKTKSHHDSSFFNSRYNGLSEELIEFLYLKKVRLVGIDAPSVDRFDSDPLVVHKKMAEYNMAILEGLCLDEVNSGIYTLISFPLKIKNAEASPVRAVLIK